MWQAVAVVFAVLLTVSCGAANDAERVASTSTPALGSSISGIQRQDPLKVAGLELTDARSGNPVPLVPPPGEVMLVYFGYTSCPDVCPTTLSDVRRALRSLGEAQAARVSLTFVTVDPERDTTEVLDGYVSSFITPNHLVRIEDPVTLRQVQGRFGARSEVGPKNADGTYEVAHTGTLYAVTNSGTVAVEWPFGTTSDVIAHDLAVLLSEPSA